MRSATHSTEVADLTVNNQEFALPTQESLHEDGPRSLNNSRTTKSRKVQVYQPPPLFNTTTVFLWGSFIVLVGSIWTPLGLALVWVAAWLQNYIFRINDEPCSRRMLLKEFQRHDMLTAPFRHVPPGVKIEETFWVNRRGMLLMTNIITPDDGQPVHAVVCYCHGYNDFPTLTRRKELFRMVKQGIAIVLIEYEGHGRSDGTLGLIKDWAKLIDDTSDFFAMVSRLKFPSIPCFLMGESMGGAVAYCTYNRNPKMFRGVVFVAPMCKIGDDVLPPKWVIKLFRWLAGSKDRNSIMGFFPLAPSQAVDIDMSVRPLKQAMMTAYPVDFARMPRIATARELLDVTMHISNDLPNFDAPFLVQHGCLDRITDPQLSVSLYEESKSKDKTLRLYDGMLHSLLCGEFDENIELVMGDSIAWVLERSKPVVTAN